MVDESILGTRIADLRNERNLSQYKMAEELGMSRGQLANYEQGSRQPDNATLQKLANFFEVSVDYLLGRTDDPRTIDQINQENAQRISDALASDPESEELLAFWSELKEREDLFLLFKQVRPLSDESIRRVMRIIKAIEDEESGQSH